MPSKKYAFKKGEPKRIEISWGIFSQKRTIRLDGKELGVIPNERALKNGWEMTSKHGTTLSIKKGSTWGAQFDIRMNGHPLPNTDGDPQRRVNNAVGAIGYIAGANIVVGLMALSGTSNFMMVTPETAPFSIITGAIYAALAFFVWRGSLIALILSLIGYGLDTASLLLLGPAGLLSLGFGGWVIRPLILIMMAMAIQPMRAVKAEKSLSAKARSPMTKLEMSLLLVVVLLIGVVAFLLVSRFVANGGLR